MPATLENFFFICKLCQTTELLLFNYFLLFKYSEASFSVTTTQVLHIACTIACLAGKSPSFNKTSLDLKLKL